MHIGVSPPEESIKVRQLVFPHSFFFFPGIQYCQAEDGKHILHISL